MCRSRAWEWGSEALIVYAVKANSRQRVAWPLQTRSCVRPVIPSRDRAYVCGFDCGSDENSVENRCKSRLSGGEGGIRTLDTLARIPVFETGLFNHSSTSPERHLLSCRTGDCKHAARLISTHPRFVDTFELERRHAGAQAKAQRETGCCTGLLGPARGGVPIKKRSPHRCADRVRPRRSASPSRRAGSA